MKPIINIKPQKRFQGSVQKDEGIFLYSLVKVIRPKTIVEFGFGHGYSAKCFLAALNGKENLYSFDPNPKSGKKLIKIKSSNFHFVHKNGENFLPTDIDNRKIDLLFIDAGHNFFSNINILKAVILSLSKNAIIAIHDTGLFNEDYKKIPWRTKAGFFVSKKGYAHQPHERAFVNWIKTKYPNFQVIHLHTMNVGRMGLTLLQKYKNLPNRSFDRTIFIEAIFKKLFLSPLKKIRSVLKKIVGKKSTLENKNN